MKSRKFTRRQVIATASLGALGTMASWPVKSFGMGSLEKGKLAILGGEKIHPGIWPKWPVWDPSADKDLSAMLATGRWYRGGGGGQVGEFEKMYAELVGAKRCLATASGTTSLITALHVVGVDAGDEVLVSPFTFIATYNAVFMNMALPVFVDSDPETFLINPKKIEEKITDRTTAILPVHIYGLPVDMDSVNKIAQSRKLKVVEDACQSWQGEYRGKKTGTLGDMGCYSFQNSKNLPAGEGGAIVSNNEELIDRCNSYHNCGRSSGTFKGTGPNFTRGGNFRMQHFQAIMLMSQMKRIMKDNDIRLENALYLNRKLKEIPGIIPYKLADGAERSSYHLYPFRYIKEEFNNVPKEKFLEALRAEGIPGSGGYGPQNKDGLIEEALNSRGYKRLFSEARLKQWREQNHLPGNDQLCKEAVVFTQNILLGSRSDMDDIVNAIAKIHENKNLLSGI